MHTVRPCTPPASGSYFASTQKRRSENSVQKSSCILSAAGRLEGEQPQISAEALVRPNAAAVPKTRTRSGYLMRSFIGACPG